MMNAAARTALIVGGDGQIGRAVARDLLEHGWRVRLARRSARAPPPDLVGRVETLQLDRDQTGALAAALNGGADVVIDTIAFTDDHARQWLELEADIGVLAVISSVSVYCDAAGRTMDEAQGIGFPQFPIPITEDQTTVAPGPETYPARKAAVEQTLLQNARRPVIVLRPGAIHGEGSRHPREWWFIKRILDGRRRIPLAYDGQSRFHTSATSNIAALCRVALEQPATRILNIVDPEALTTNEIGHAIASVYGVDLDLVALPGPPVRGVGEHPWCIPAPMIMGMTRAHALGYHPVAAYRDTIGEDCRSAEAAAKAGVKFPDYLASGFDYLAEDAVLAGA
jgi:nucleoside-diphosphate-sugar epimerase